jgi:hypothetical protein
MNTMTNLFHHFNVVSFVFFVGEPVFRYHEGHEEHEAGAR